MILHIAILHIAILNIVKNSMRPVRTTLTAAVLLAGVLPAQGDEAGIGLDGAHWIWRQKESPDGEVVHFRKTFDLAGDVRSARIAATCDNHMIVHLNGKQLLSGDEWGEPVATDVTRRLKRGKNVLAVRARNDGSIAGLVLKLQATLEGEEKLVIVTDETWRATGTVGRGWRRLDHDDRDWAAVHVHGKFGVGPWGQVGAPQQQRQPQATPAESLAVLDGFRAELLYTVPKAEQGSWVSLTTWPGGRLIASDQYGALYRITPPAIGGDAAETRVERLDVKMGSAHGLLYAFDSLYVVVNGNAYGQSSGLYRLRDTTGDEQFDEVKKLKELKGSGEHGPHAVIVTPDREGLLVLGGNHTDPPAGLARTSPTPLVWDEDLLLPRQWDARGHARGKLAPGGWVCRTDPDGERWEIVSNGYRNQYDVAVNRDGEVFTFDADMEWDLGTPWYRPTRVNHVVSASEFGWRSGTGKWPEYYEDSLPATIDIGPGSPTGVAVGTGAKFPARYQDALYILDWTFGTMYAIHLIPDGASYRAEKEEFVSGRPLPLTDAVIATDGAMYFTIGGRRTQSALYRISYTGAGSTEPAPAGPRNASEVAAAEARQLRRRLERYHGKQDPAAVDSLWPYLGNADRFVRYAARIALEHQEIGEWQERALAEPDPTKRISAMLALARHGDASLEPEILAALDSVDFETLDVARQLALLRAYALAFTRMGKPDRRTAERVARRLDAFYPAREDSLNRELSRLLVYLNSPTVISKTLDLMERAQSESSEDIQALLARNEGYGKTVLEMFRNQPARQKMHYALVLRNMRFGWTLEQRRKYFAWFDEAAKASGGASYRGFVKNIRKEALANCSAAERRALADLTGETVETAAAPEKIPQPKGPGREWQMNRLLALVGQGLRERSFENGKAMYAAARCASCHRFDGSGGDLGPDLTNVSGRFSHRDLLESILEPSKVMSDQYESMVVVARNGSVVTGRIVASDDTEIAVAADAMNPERVIRFARSDVIKLDRSPVSLMPADLLNKLNGDEVLDLLAYMMSRGDREDPAFRRDP